MAQPSSPPPGQGDDSSQGAPGAAGQGQAQPQGQQGGGGGPISDLLNNVGGALQHLEQVFAASKSIDPQEQKMMSQIVQMYGQLMSSLSEDSGEAQQGPQGGSQGQTSPMEAGGNKGAVPAM